MFGRLDAGPTGRFGAHHFYTSCIRTLSVGKQDRPYVLGYFAECGQTSFCGEMCK